MSDGEEHSRLDKKIAAESLLTQIAPLWDDLYAAAVATGEKVRQAFDRHSTTVLNDHGTVIRTAYSEQVPSQIFSIQSTLEMRLERNARKLTVNISRQGSSQGIAMTEPPRVYDIAADVDGQSLYFRYKQERYSAIQLAEHLIVERLMKKSLE
jgi:protein-tyrosine-phosphatase